MWAQCTKVKRVVEKSSELLDEHNLEIITCCIRYAVTPVDVLRIELLIQLFQT